MAKAKILIVEDEALVAMDLQDTLEDLGYDVSAITALGKKAVEKAEEVKPDLALMDIALKGELDGIEAAEQIYNRFNIPIVYLTGYMNKERLKRAENTGAFDYIIKPFDEKFLSAVIEAALQANKK